LEECRVVMEKGNSKSRVNLWTILQLADKAVELRTSVGSSVFPGDFFVDFDSI
jgi:hypothetical protein